MTANGQIKHLTGKGYGFIRTETKEEYFFLASEFNGRWDDLRKGDRVQFEPDLGSEKPRAKQVTLVPKEDRLESSTEKKIGTKASRGRSGLNVSHWFKEKKPFSAQDKVENLERFVQKHIPNQTLLVLFDELDEDYKEMFKDYNKSEYLDLLTSLFKAVQDVRAVLGAKPTRLFPVIFLRDDIYDLIQDSDKNKWRDLEVDLKWSDEEIRALLAHRLSKVMGSGTEDFDKLWYSIFSPQPFLYAGGYKEIHSFEYMKMSAQRRPRDYINYLQECASIELKRSGLEISPDTIKDADKSYSNYLRKEMIDEIHGIIPDIARVLAIFSESRKWILSIDEFRDAYRARIKTKSMAIEDVDFVLQTLFYFSVIGNVVRVGLHIFRHERSDAQLNFKEKIVVHRGLMKALQIV